MTTLYITRHGETVWNLEKKMQGWQDSPLTEHGKMQAEWLGERLKEIELDAVYSSPSERALSTARIIKGSRDLCIKCSDNLREINIGGWEGRLASDIRKETPDLLHAFYHTPHLFKLDRAETFHDVGERAVPEILKICEEHPLKNVLIVTHTVTLKMIMSYFEKRPVEKLWDLPFIYQTSLSVVEVCDNNCEIMLHGDISHYKNAVDAWS